MMNLTSVLLLLLLPLSLASPLLTLDSTPHNILRLSKRTTDSDSNLSDLILTPRADPNFPAPQPPPGDPHGRPSPKSQFGYYIYPPVPATVECGWGVAPGPWYYNVLNCYGQIKELADLKGGHQWCCNGGRRCGVYWNAGNAYTQFCSKDAIETCVPCWVVIGGIMDAVAKCTGVDGRMMARIG